MAPEPIKTDPTLTEGEKQKRLEREIRQMISSLIHRLSELQNVEKHHSQVHEAVQANNINEENEGGVRIITLAGSNTGASMRGELHDKSSSPGGVGRGTLRVSENEDLDTYMNSNFQAINNSMLLGGSYSTHDPGVHMNVTDNYLEEPDHNMAK